MLNYQCLIIFLGSLLAVALSIGTIGLVLISISVPIAVSVAIGLFASFLSFNSRDAFAFSARCVVDHLYRTIATILARS
jgi:hypothetical protein